MQSCQLCGAKIWEPLGGGEEIRLGRHRISGEKIFLSGPDSDYVQCVNCKSIALKSQVESLLIDTPYVPPPDPLLGMLASIPKLMNIGRPLPDEPQTRLERLVVALLRANSRFKAAYGTTTDEYVTWTMATARALDAALEPEGTVSPDG